MLVNICGRLIETEFIQAISEIEGNDGVNGFYFAVHLVNKEDPVWISTKPYKDLIASQLKSKWPEPSDGTPESDKKVHELKYKGYKEIDTLAKEKIEKLRSDLLTFMGEIEHQIPRFTIE